MATAHASGDASLPSDAAWQNAAAPLKSPSKAQQLAFITGVKADGELTGESYWNRNGETANKWGPAESGTGAAITYGFDPASGFSPTERKVFERALALWASVADVSFSRASSRTADVVLHRGEEGEAFQDGPLTSGEGRRLGAHSGQAAITLDTSVFGFDLSGSLEKAGGYGFATAVHEIGHLLGLGHSGDYNGDANAARDQYSAFDDTLWTVMSYHDWTQARHARFRESYPVKGTDWGMSADGTDRVSGNTLMQLDILAVQQLYGEARRTPFAKGQTFGFHATVQGPLGALFDFSRNKAPVVTLYSQAENNTLDLSGFGEDATVNLREGAFSSVGGLSNNLSIAAGTRVDHVIGGTGRDAITGNERANRLDGGQCADVLRGLEGDDTYLVDDPYDRVVEAAGGGIDTVHAWVSFRLAGRFVENLTLRGGEDLDAVGNARRNVLTGNSGDNVLTGGAGQDRLIGNGGRDTASYAGAKDGVTASLADPLLNTGDAAGDSYSGIENLRGSAHGDALTGNQKGNWLAGGRGADELAGGAGRDTFLFDTAPGGRHGADTLTDFAGGDRIALDASLFAVRADRHGALLTNLFKDVAAAGACLDQDDRILYDSATGALSYDADGSGRKSAVLFASIETLAHLGAQDFLVV